MPDFALELSFDAAGDAAIVAQWEALRAAGLPSQADHTSMTNAPHVTLVAATALPHDLAEAAAGSIDLPSTLVVRGLVLFGEGARVTVAHLVEPSVALATATHALRAAAPELRHPVWTPHVTLARRVPRGRLPEVLSVLAETDGPRTITADRLRWWDPVAGEIEDLATSPIDGVASVSPSDTEATSSDQHMP